jgi:hypothetical protein
MLPDWTQATREIRRFLASRLLNNRTRVKKNQSSNLSAVILAHGAEFWLIFARIPQRGPNEFLLSVEIVHVTSAKM